MAKPPIPADDIPSMKDRSNVAALVLVLEAIVTAVAKSHIAGLNDAGKQACKADIAESLQTICGEVVASAPITGRGASLAPAAAKRAAGKIQEDAEGLLQDYLGDLFPASKR